MRASKLTNSCRAFFLSLRHVLAGGLLVISIDTIRWFTSQMDWRTEVRGRTQMLLILDQSLSDHAL